MTDANRPVLIELDDSTPVAPEEAPPFTDDVPTGAAMQTVARLGARRGSRLGRWFWRLGLAVLGFALSLWAWEALTALVARNQYLGYAALALTGAFLLVCLAIVVREWAAFARLNRLDRVNKAAAAALAAGDLEAARKVTNQLSALYAGRPETRWGRDRLAERQAEILDADGLLALAESELLVPLDAIAQTEIDTAARQVAAITAIVPLALVDVAAALTANIRMIGRIAEVYGGRPGTIGSWRLARTVLTHLVATGAVAVGEDLIGSVAGGGVLSKLSRRFGEGVINGALTARVGIAAMEVCRPMPFLKASKPTIAGTVQRALAGLFNRK